MSSKTNNKRLRSLKIKNVLIFLSGVVFICLAVPASMKGLAAGAIAAVCLLILLQFCRQQTIRELLKDTSVTSRIIAALIWILFAAMFVYKWQYSSKIVWAASLLHMSNIMLLVLIAVCSVVAVPFLLFVVNSIPENNYLSFPDEGMKSGEKIYSRASTVIFLLIVSAAVITLCSKSSPLYPLNDWVDSNCFFTVGKSMLNGKVIYRDIYEQKGPLLYMIHAVAYLISNTSFLGVWLIEIAACFGFMYFSYKSVRMFCTEKVLLLMPVMALAIYTQASFSHGDSAEELCLPLLAYGMYIGLKSIKQKKNPSLKECILIGVTSACVFWIKYTMVGFYIGWFIFPAVMLIAKRRWKKLGGMVLAIAAGVIVLSIPILLYFAANGAVLDLWEGYFYNNIFVYGNASEGSSFAWISGLLGGAHSTIAYSPLTSILTILGLIWAFNGKDKKLFLDIFLTGAGAFFLIFAATSVRYVYYSFCLAVFAPIGLIPIALLLEDKLPDRRTVMRAASSAAAIVCIIASGLLTQNRYLMFTSKDELPQYQFDEIISTVEDATLLNYGFLDGGFYTVSNIVPTCKYFAALNISLQEMTDTQNEYVNQALIDFVVTRDKTLDSENYECVAECEFWFEGADHMYYLYELKTLIE